MNSEVFHFTSVRYHSAIFFLLLIIISPNLIAQKNAGKTSTKPGIHSHEEQTSKNMNDWVPVTEPGAPAREGHSMVTIDDGRVLMFGGEDANADLFNDLHVFQDANWSKIEPEGIKPESRKDQTTWVSNNKMYIMGGLGENEQLLNDLWTFDPGTNAWSEEFVDSGPRARQRFGAVLRGNKKVLMTGGQGENEYGGTTELDDVWEFTPPDYSYPESNSCILNKNDGGVFRELLEKIPHVVWGHKMFLHAGKIIIAEIFAGGFHMFKMDDATETWATIDITGDKPNFSPLAAAIDLSAGFMKIGGWGYFPSALYKTNGFRASEETWFFDYSTESWTQYPSLPEGIFGSCSVYDSLNQRIKVYGGKKADSTINDKVYIFQWGAPVNTNDISLPTEFSLEQNYPNPFNPATTISYVLDKQSEITLSVHDILGREIAVVEKGIKSAGRHKTNFFADELTSGVYFYTLRTPEKSSTKKFVLLR